MLEPLDSENILCAPFYLRYSERCSNISETVHPSESLFPTSFILRDSKITILLHLIFLSSEAAITAYESFLKYKTDTEDLILPLELVFTPHHSRIDVECSAFVDSKDTIDLSVKYFSHFNLFVQRNCLNLSPLEKGFLINLAPEKKFFSCQIKKNIVDRYSMDEVFVTRPFSYIETNFPQQNAAFSKTAVLMIGVMQQTGLLPIELYHKIIHHFYDAMFQEAEAKFFQQVMIQNGHEISFEPTSVSDLCREFYTDQFSAVKAEQEGLDEPSIDTRHVLFYRILPKLTEENTVEIASMIWTLCSCAHHFGEINISTARQIIQLAAITNYKIFEDFTADHAPAIPIPNRRRNIINSEKARIVLTYLRHMSVIHFDLILPKPLQDALPDYDGWITAYHEVLALNLALKNLKTSYLKIKQSRSAQHFEPYSDHIAIDKGASREYQAYWRIWQTLAGVKGPGTYEEWCKLLGSREQTLNSLGTIKRYLMGVCFTLIEGAKSEQIDLLDLPDLIPSAAKVILFPEKQERLMLEDVKPTPTVPKQDDPTPAKTLDDMPLDVLIEILAYVPMDMAMESVFLVNTRWATLKPAFWEKKFKQHFPHRYQATAPTVDQSSPTGWRTAILQTYKDEYAKNTKAQRRWLTCVKEGDLERLKEDPPTFENLTQTQDKARKYLIDWALKKNNQAILDYFYELGQEHFNNPETKLSKGGSNVALGHTHLAWAILCGQSIETLDSLIKHDARMLSWTIMWHMTPLHVATKTGQLNVVQHLIKTHHVDLNEYNKWFASSPLCIAIEYGHDHIINYLLNAGAEIENNDWTWNALHNAAKYGRFELVKLLVNHYKAHINVTNTHHETPLLLAIQEGHKDIVQFLLDNGATIQENNKSIEVILHAIDRDHANILELLFKHGHAELINTALDWSHRNFETYEAEKHPNRREFRKKLCEQQEKLTVTHATITSQLTKEDKSIVDDNQPALINPESSSPTSKTTSVDDEKNKQSEKPNTVTNTTKQTSLKPSAQPQNKYSSSEALRLFLLFVLLLVICVAMGFFIGGFANVWDGVSPFLEAIKLGTDWGIGVLVGSFAASAIVTGIVKMTGFFSDEKPGKLNQVADHKSFPTVPPVQEKRDASTYQQTFASNPDAAVQDTIGNSSQNEKILSAYTTVDTKYPNK